MEANEDKKPVAGTEIAAEQASEVGGGTSTVTIGGSCTSIATTGNTTGAALIDVYEGAIELTTHVLERVTSKS